MIRNVGHHLKTLFTNDILRVTVLLGLLLILAPRIQSQTPCNMTVPHGCKPSDVFFGSPSDLQIAEEKVGLRSIGQEVGKNYLSPHSIVAKDVVLRGWLTCAMDPDPNNPKWTCPGPVVPNKDNIGIGDMHYELMLDYDFIVSTYGANAGILNGAMLPGHGPDTWDTQATPLPFKNPLANTVTGIDINSFWLPTTTDVPKFHVELNAWHPDSSHRGCQWVLGNPVGCSAHNFEGRGPAPAGWIEKDYGPVETNSSQNWWPFDTDNPDGSTEPVTTTTLQHGPNYPQYQDCIQKCDCAPDARGKPNATCLNACLNSCRKKIPNAFASVTTTSTGPKNLQVGDYVEMKGTLWQDLYHHEQRGPDTYYTYCWNVNPFQNQGGWLELHPVDSIRRVSAPGYSPYDVTPVSNPTESAKQGVKRIFGVSLCSDTQGASNNLPYTAMRAAVCPDKNYGLDDPNSGLHTRPLQPLAPHYLKVVDGRFTDAAGVGAATTHKVDVVADCVYIQDYWPPGLKSAHYKAAYVVWWTPPASPAIINQPANNVVSLGQTARFAVTVSGATPLSYQWRRNGMAISGALSPNYVTPPVTPSDLGAQFTVVVTNSMGTITSAAATILGQLSATVSSTVASGLVTDTITVTSGAAPVAGVTVTSGTTAGNSAFVTNTSGVVVITHGECFIGPIAKVGDTTAPKRTPVPCKFTETASKPGYQTLSFIMP